MSVYIIAELTIHDREEYGKYEVNFFDILNAHNGTLVSVDEDPQMLEGEWTASRSVILSFAQRDAAIGWFSSNAYQNIAKHRRAASVGNIRLVDEFVMHT